MEQQPGGGFAKGHGQSHRADKQLNPGISCYNKHAFSLKLFFINCRNTFDVQIIQLFAVRQPDRAGADNFQVILIPRCAVKQRWCDNQV
ncbi:hypothetical protein D3C81_2008140 [compost metagenome]